MLLNKSCQYENEIDTNQYVIDFSYNTNSYDRGDFALEPDH
jgi:hypothetical protein